VMKEVKQEAKRREIELLVLPTTKAIAALKKNPQGSQRDPACDLLDHSEEHTPHTTINAPSMRFRTPGTSPSPR
jgi:hypothetical protein